MNLKKGRPRSGAVALRAHRACGVGGPVVISPLHEETESMVCESASQVWRRARVGIQRERERERESERERRALCRERERESFCAQARNLSLALERGLR